MSSPRNLIAVNVGNSRTQIGRFGDAPEAAVKGGLEQSDRFTNTAMEPIVDQIARWWAAMSEESGGPDPDAAAIVLASVNDQFADELAGAIESRLETEVYRIGSDVPIPIGTQLDRETITGVDRLLNAAAAYDRVKQACVIVDAGTAVTVDFVDGQGTFHGGAIAPGASMQLLSLHQHTANLPELKFQAPDKEAVGRNTAQAMYQGVFHGIRGMVQRLVEQYAEYYGAFPMVIATGGDAAVLFENDELIDRIVPELTLLGIAAAAKYALADEQT